MEQIGLRNNVLKLFVSYINNRKQVVQIHNSLSDLKEIDFGVAQGSKLGPLLFLIYINDLFEIKLNGSLQLYADDSSVTYVTNNVTALHKLISEDLISISNWFKDNLLVLNGSKTKILFFNDFRIDLKNFPNLFINDSKISIVSEMKYLGLIIDSNLTWNNHINSLIKKLSPYVGVFRRISFLCGNDVKKILYYSFFYSNITYLLTVWSGTKKENISKLKIIQNKCIRNLFFNQYRVGNISTNDLFNEHNILEFENIINLEMCINFYKIHKKYLKCDINLELNSNYHNYATRQSHKVHKIKNKNKYGVFSFVNRGISTFNVIPSPIKKAKNVNQFKKKIKSLLYNKQLSNLINMKPKRKFHSK